MTNEEAIERIEMTIYYFESLDLDDEEEKDLEALYIAVSAIKKQNAKRRKKNENI